MEWFIANWSLLVVAAVILAIVIVGGILFFKLPIAAQKTKIKEWLLWAVVEAEKDLGAGTGQLKLRKVYEMFISKFPFLSSLIPFATFSNWVDEALIKMKNLLSNSLKIAEYVANENEKT